MSPRALGSHVLKRRFCPTKTGIHWVETGNSCSTSTPELPGWDTHFGHPAEPSNSFMAVLQLQVSHLVPFPSRYGSVTGSLRICSLRICSLRICNRLNWVSSHRRTGMIPPCEMHPWTFKRCQQIPFDHEHHCKFPGLCYCMLCFP